MELYAYSLDILQLDRSVFQFINKDLGNVFFDVFLPFMRNKYVWIPFYVFILAFVGFNYKSNKAWFYVCAALMMMTSDQLSSNLIKNTVKRTRPCNEIKLEPTIVKRIPCSSGYSFTSSHATNHFAVALFLYITLGSYLLLFRWPIIAWAIIIAFAQIYVGVHYPLDILCGSILGTTVGFLFGTILVNLNNRLSIN